MYGEDNQWSDAVDLAPWTERLDDVEIPQVVKANYVQCVELSDKFIRLDIQLVLVHRFDWVQCTFTYYLCRHLGSEYLTELLAVNQVVFGS